MEKGIFMQLFFKGLIRGVILCTIWLIIRVLINGFENNWNLYIFNMVISFILGFASIIYEIEKWSFPKQIIAHYMTMLITVFPTMLLSGFYPLNSFNDLLHVYMQFNKAGIFLFLLTFFVFKLFRVFKTEKAKEI